MIRGTLLLMIGQIVFVLSGYAVNIVLSRTLGVEQYGLFGVVMSVLVWVELSVIVGIPTALQKFIGENNQQAYTLRRAAFDLQWKYAALIFFLFFAAAGMVARALNDDRLAFYLRVASADIVLYALYRLFVNVHNGMRNFGRQAVASIVYALGKMAAIFLLVWQGMAVVGALIGNALGSALGLLSAVAMRTNIQPAHSAFEKTRMIRYAAPIIVFTLLINLFLSVDLWFVKAYLDSTAAGYYVAASTIAKAPYFLFLALSFTLLPSLANARKSQDAQRAGTLILQSTRILLGSLALMATLVMSSAGSLIELLFTELYAPAEPILNILICGLAFLTVFMVFATMLNVDDRPAIAVWICAGVGFANLGLNLWWVPRFGATGAAWATTLSTFVGMLWSGAMVWRKFGVLVNLRTVLRAAFAAVVAYAIGEQMPEVTSMLLPKYALMVGAFGAVLYFSGEIRSEDISKMKESLRAHDRESVKTSSVSHS